MLRVAAVSSPQAKGLANSAERLLAVTVPRPFLQRRSTSGQLRLQAFVPGLVAGGWAVGRRKAFHRMASAAFEPPARGAEEAAARCGALSCQKDSYAKSLQTRVRSCCPSREKKEKGKVWEVCLLDTVLFPEGGGQPWDLGKVGDANVLRVVNIDGHAVHFVDAQLKEGAEVDVVVDWARREDLMHQHSAQHLITALAVEMFGYETLMWDLKPDPTAATTLDLGTEELKPEEMEALERRVNEAIANEHAVAPRWIEQDSEEVAKIRCRGLPDGVVGPLRALEMDGIDTNLCCGTHVKSTAHLRQVKLLHTERIRDRGKTHVRLHFVAGSRVLGSFDSAYKRQLQLNSLLAVGPEGHCSSVEAMLAAKKEKAKEVKTLLAEVVEFTAERLRQRVLNGEKVLDIHRESGDMDLMKDLASALDDTSSLLLTTFGGPGSGTFMLSGPPELVAKLGPGVAEVLQGRGGGKGRYQGKAEKISARGEAIAMLQQAMVESQ
ncbi:unnamed protein product [Polarella glacialis]|uniref:Threonyl/alanyl tRNA synthetase SAD domain-containing protein n=1 Tax=Polarella glacialis TaxID=89957 RepID=A0A813L1V2_POLGL|nr:unnamed protein product [Polarella glacialis]